MSAVALKQQFPLRLIIGREDCTQLLDDNFTFSSRDPGGFEAASFAIPKDMPDALRGSYVRMDCGLDVAFEGRVSQVQRSLGSRTQIQCEGNSGVLKDNDGSMVFVDRDLTRWISPSVARQIALVSGNFQLGTSQVAADPTSNTPALVQSITDSWVSPYIPIDEAWYDAGPENLIAQIYYNLSLGANYGGAWIAQLFASIDANLTADVGSANLAGTATASGYWTPASQYRFGGLQHYYNATPSGTQGAQYNAYWKNLAVYGPHGLTGRGSDPVGFYPSDIAGWAISQAPGLQPGVIVLTDQTGYIVPHSVYYTPVGLDQIVDDMATAAGWHWGVWEALSPLTGNPASRCDFRPRPPLGQFTGFCLRRDCETCDIREDLSQQYNECTVTYSNADGTDGAVTVTVDNPILDQAGIQSRTLNLSGGTMTGQDAALFGQMALAFTYNQARVAGSVQIDQPIRSAGGPMAAWMLKPGIDRLRIGDLPSFDAFGTYNDVPLSRMEMSGSSQGFTTSLEVGQGASMVETLQARLAAATALAGVGG